MREVVSKLRKKIVISELSLDFLHAHLLFVRLFPRRHEPTTLFTLDTRLWPNEPMGVVTEERGGAQRVPASSVLDLLAYKAKHCYTGLLPNPSL